MSVDVEVSKKSLNVDDLPQKSSTFWFESGDFIIISSQISAFRVHSDVVGRRSRVFSDLFHSHDPSRRDLDDNIDGCPIVRVTDSPDEFEMLLRLIYEGLMFYQELMKAPRWTTTKAMIILGDKYDVPEIHEAGLSQLREWYSPDIDRWDARDNNFFANEADHMSVASITRPLNDPWIHAAVIYHCCSVPAREMVYGREDWPRLCPEDLICILNFRYQASGDYIDLVSEVFDERFDDMLSACAECCKIEEPTRTRVDEFAADEIRSNCPKLLHRDIWDPIYKELKQSLCKRCFGCFKTRLHMVRRRYRAELIHKIKPYSD